MLSDWLDNPVAFGAFEGDTLIGFDRYAYSNDGPDWNTLAEPYAPKTHHLNEEETVLNFTVGRV